MSSLTNGEDFDFVNAIVGGVVPKEYIPAVEKGTREAMKHGVLAGYPMTGVKATLFFGKYHPVDSKEVAFKTAARLAYKEACAQARARPDRAHLSVQHHRSQRVYRRHHG